VKLLPNLLTAARLAMAPWVIWLIHEREYRAVLLWFVAAGITDALDGWLARRMSVTSRFGQILDPIADKVLLSGVFLALALRGDLPWWLAWMVFGRDALIVGFAAGAMAFTKTRRSFPPSIWGKLSTIVQMICAAGVVLDRAGLSLPVTALVWAAAATTAWSGIDYARRVLAA
jgi:cardiolipin synthase